MKLFVKSPTGRTICLRVQPSDTLHTVQTKIQKQHRLSFDGVKLEDDRTLADYGIEHRATVDLQESMQVHVRETLGGLTMTLEVDSLDTIDMVKTKIEDIEGFPKGQQCLIFGNNQLQDDSTLADLDIWQGSTLLLVLRPSTPGGTGRMRILIKKLDGNTLTIRAESSDTVNSVMVKIYEAAGHSPKEQRLIFAGKQLEKGRTLADYGIQEGDRLHLVFRLCGC